MLNCANEREIISPDGNYQSDFYIDMLESCRARKVTCFTYPSRTFLPSPDEIHLRFWINAAHYCSSNLQKLTQESERQIGDFIYHKRLSHVAKWRMQFEKFWFRLHACQKGPARMSLRSRRAEYTLTRRTCEKEKSTRGAGRVIVEE